MARGLCQGECSSQQGWDHAAVLRRGLCSYHNDTWFYDISTLQWSCAKAGTATAPAPRGESILAELVPQGIPVCSWWYLLLF